ncbi:MAG TPA: hypothetical protein VGC25_01930 [Alphaproteobacteria bacterium]
MDLLARFADLALEADFLAGAFFRVADLLALAAALARVVLRLADFLRAAFFLLAGALRRAAFLLAGAFLRAAFFFAGAFLRAFFVLDFLAIGFLITDSLLRGFTAYAVTNAVPCNAVQYAMSSRASHHSVRRKADNELFLAFFATTDLHFGTKNISTDFDTRRPESSCERVITTFDSTMR